MNWWDESDRLRRQLRSLEHPVRIWRHVSTSSDELKGSDLSRKVQFFMALFLLIVIIFFMALFYDKSAKQAQAQQLAFPLWVSIAQQEIGHGETIANNRGMDVRRYLGKDGQPWCAGFVSYCLRESGFEYPYILRAKDYLKIGRVVSKPRSGDLIVFNRIGGGHVGIIESVEEGSITTIEGNVGDYPAKVKRIVYKGKPARLAGFVRLEKGRGEV